MTSQQIEFLQIDIALSIYFRRSGKHDYFGDDGKGKFLKFIIEEEFIDPDIPIEHELGLACNPNDCVYTCFVDIDKFPNPIDCTIPNESKLIYIFYIIQYCWIHGYPPSDGYIRTVLLPRMAVDTYSIAILGIGQLLLTQMCHQAMSYILGFGGGWLWITALWLTVCVNNN
eukprot:333110_1